MATMMTKKDVLTLFGGNQSDVADALGISRQAFSRWGYFLSVDRADRVLGAALRHGIGVKKVIALRDKRLR